MDRSASGMSISVATSYKVIISLNGIWKIFGSDYHLPTKAQTNIWLIFHLYFKVKYQPTLATRNDQRNSWNGGCVLWRTNYSISMYDRGDSENLSYKKIIKHNKNYEKFFKYLIKELLCKKNITFWFQISAVICVLKLRSIKWHKDHPEMVPSTLQTLRLRYQHFLEASLFLEYRKEVHV